MAKTPKIRFKNFSDEWVERKADEICTIETGKSNTQDQNDNGKYPFYIRSDKPVRSNKFLYDCEAVITIGDGSIGKVFHYVKGKFDLHQRCYKMTDFKDVTGKYFYYYFSTKFYDRAMKMTAKATVDSVRLEMISDMFFSIPNNLAEQCKISEFFTKLDNLITLHQSKFEKLQKIKKSCLQNLFPQNNQNTPKIRFKNFTDEWMENKLEKIANRFDNLRIPISADKRISGSIPYYGANGIQDHVKGYTHNGEFILIAEDGANDLKNYPVQYVNGKFFKSFAPSSAIKINSPLCVYPFT